MINEIFQSGNTVRFTCTFKDYDGVETDPTLVKLIIYDYQYNKIDEISMTDANQTGVGSFQYDYTIPNMQSQFKSKTHIYYEWYGEMHGKPSIKRNTIMVQFV